jgi:hypothetical protein
MNHRLSFAAALVGLLLALACGSASEQMEASYQDRVEQLDAAATSNPGRSAEIHALRDGFAARYAALPSEPAAREAALGTLNQEMRAAIDAEAAAAKAAGAAAGEALRPALVGSWAGSGVTLVIEPGGMVHYAKHAGGVDTSVDAPIQGVTATSFEVGFLGITTTFAVDTPPHSDGGVWKMTVDGVELTRSP